MKLLLTCLKLRAVHFKVAVSSHPIGCIVELEMIVAHYVVAGVICWDNCTNFIANEKQLLGIFLNCNQQTLIDSLVHKDKSGCLTLREPRTTEMFGSELCAASKSLSLLFLLIYKILMKISPLISV